jgi:DNA-binding MarR family transcriptional regulator
LVVQNVNDECVPRSAAVHFLNTALLAIYPGVRHPPTARFSIAVVGERAERCPASIVSPKSSYSAAPLRGPEPAAPRAAGRSTMDLEARRNLQTLEAIDEDDRITQRNLAAKLGIALGLTNIYLKRLVRKGYVKCVNVQSNRLRYLLTPTGIAEKTRLTYEFMEYSLFLYSQVRQHLGAVLRAAIQENRKRIAIHGTGEAAELAYLSVAELGLELAAVFDATGERRFLGHAVRPIAEHRSVAFDLLVIGTLDCTDRVVAQLIELGIERDRMVTLR